LQSNVTRGTAENRIGIEKTREEEERGPMNRDKPPQKEAILGRYLSAWVEDLRAGRSPEVDQQCLEELSEIEIRELLETARFTKALLFPTEPTQGQSSTIQSRLGQLVFEVRQKQLASGRVIAYSSKDFGQCLRTARTSLGLSIEELSSECEVPGRLLEDVEEGKRSPIRVPVAKMVNLVLRLYIGLDQVVDLIKASAEGWARETFPKNQVQFGRIGKDITERERRKLLEEAGIEDVDASLERELNRASAYTDVLRRVLRETERGPI
jgi:transcriptional regulator with XRE-family HTH domain